MANVESRFKDWTKPARTNQVLSTVADLSRSKAELIAENMFLRQQVIVLEPQIARPLLKPRDRQAMVWLASWLPSWREALMIVKLDTLISWHRQGFRRYWRRESRVRQGRPPISSETIRLIEELARNNRTWRAKRIQGELTHP